MKKVRFLFLILALILIVGMTTGLIVRKQSGGQTVMQHSGAPAPVSTTPATTGDDEPAAPEAEVFKIPVLIREGISQYFTVLENGVEVDPVDVFEYSDSSSKAEAKGGNEDPDPEPDESYSVTYVRYLVDPTCSSVVFDHNLRRDDPWFYYEGIENNFSFSGVFQYFNNDETYSSGSIGLSDCLCLYIY